VFHVKHCGAGRLAGVSRETVSGLLQSTVFHVKHGFGSHALLVDDGVRGQGGVRARESAVGCFDSLGDQGCLRQAGENIGL